MDIFIAVMMVIAAGGCFIVITVNDWVEARKRSPEHMGVATADSDR
jgi:hypothetical protein